MAVPPCPPPDPFTQTEQAARELLRFQRSLGKVMLCPIDFGREHPSPKGVPVSRCPIAFRCSPTTPNCLVKRERGALPRSPQVVMPMARKFLLGAGSDAPELFHRKTLKDRWHCLLLYPPENHRVSQGHWRAWRLGCSAPCLSYR